MQDGGLITLLLAALTIVFAIWAVARGFDVRLALFGAALVMGGLSGDPAPVVRKFIETFSNEKFVIPICSAMGFAYVLRLTECDRHLVLLLTNPLRRARIFLIPGVVGVGFLVNIPVISQTSTAVCLGAVIVPLMRAARLSSLTIGTSLLLGASIGGELLNPGAPELNTVAQRLSISAKDDVIPRVVPLLFPHLLLATGIFWFMRLRAERQQIHEPTETNALETTPLERVNYVRALVPLVPLALLFLTGPPLNLVKIPEQWVVPRPAPDVAFVAGGAPLVLEKKDSHYDTRLIALAMLVGVLAATLANPKHYRQVARSFFEGAGYAFAEIVSLIVVATCFGEAVERVGLSSLIGEVIRHMPNLLFPAAMLVPLSFAALSGSGMAATQSLYQFFVKPAEALGANPIDVGAVVSLASAAGRTMSPVAAVALMCAKLTGTTSFQLARGVAPPLLVSLTIVVLLRMLGLL